jgi:MFS family permease
MLIASAGMFGTFLFLTYYLQETLGYSPLRTGFAFLPLVGAVAVFANLSNIVLIPRVGPKPLITIGMLAAAGGMAWLTRLGVNTGYTGGVLGPLILTGLGLGLVIAPSMNTGTFGVAPEDAGVASAMVTTGQQLGASVGTSLLNTIFASAVASYLIAHPGSQALAQLHGYDTAFWWTAGIFAAGAVVGGLLLRRGPLVSTAAPRAVPSTAATLRSAGSTISPLPGIVPGRPESGASPSQE